MSLRKVGLLLCSAILCCAVTAHSNPYADKLREGWNLLEKGQVARSGLVFAEAISLDTQHPAAHLSLAVAASLQQDWKTAVTEYQTALASDARDAVAWNGLGIAHLQQGQAAEARACFEKALEIEPDYAVARGHLAFTLCLHNLSDSALEECDRVMKAGPDSEVSGFVHQTRALAFLLKRYHEEATRALNDAWRDVLAPKTKPYAAWVGLVEPRAALAAVAHPLFVAQTLPPLRMVAAAPPVQRNDNEQPKPPVENGNGQPKPPTENGAPPEPKPVPPPPTIAVTLTPFEGLERPVVRGVVTVVANVTSPVPVRYVIFTLGGRIRAITNAPPYQWRWNTLVDSDGDKELVVRAHGTAKDLLVENKVSVRVQNKASEPPTDNECVEVDESVRSSAIYCAFDTQGTNEEADFARQHARPLLVLSAQSNALRYLKAKVYQSQEQWDEAYNAYMSVYVDDPSYLDVRAQVLTLRDRVAPVPTDEVLEVRAFPALGNVIALTFDDGPRSPYTERILATLRQYNVKATFFLVGKMVEQYPELAQQIARDGHELANHSYLHYNMERMTPQTLEIELLRCEHAVRRVTGKNIRLFRPPGGHYDEDVRQAIIGLGYKTIFWTANITSFPLLPPDQIASKLVERVGLGGIILLHNGMDKSAYVLPRLLQLLKERGTQFVTVGEMLEMAKRR